MTRHIDLFSDDDYDQKLADTLVAASLERGFPAPEIFISDFGYRRARCPRCATECLLRGYTMHYRRAHTDEYTKYRSRKGTKYMEPTVDGTLIINHSVNSDERYIDRMSPERWQQLHDESMARLAKREKPLPGWKRT